MRNPISPLGKRFAFVHAETSKAAAAYKSLVRTYGQSNPADADVVVVIGGDGFMLQTLNRFGGSGKPVFGMNRGTVGFLLNDYRIKDFPARLDNAKTVRLYRLLMRATTVDGVVRKARAINEVSLFRQTGQSAHLAVEIDGVNRLSCLVCDGILLATPAGSTAYNLSAHGPIIPLSSNLVALTPICAFRPRRWSGALLHNRTCVTIKVLDAGKRPVAATADGVEIRDVVSVEIETDRRHALNLLFDDDLDLQERILQEQFIES